MKKKSKKLNDIIIQLKKRVNINEVSYSEIELLMEEYGLKNLTVDDILEEVKKSKVTIEEPDPISNQDITEKYPSENLLKIYLLEIRKYELLTKEEEQKYFKEISLLEKEIKNQLKEINLKPKFFQKLQKINLTAASLKKISYLNDAQVKYLINNTKPVLKKYLKLRNFLIQSNLRLVVSIAKKYMNFGLPLTDLINEGNIGLMKSIEKFDYKKGWRFVTYSSWWIRQSVTRALAEKSRTIRIPVHIVELINKIRKLKNEFYQSEGRYPKTGELAEKMFVSEEKIKEIENLAVEPSSLDTSISYETNTQLLDVIEDNETGNPFQEFHDRQLIVELKDLLSVLSEKERNVILYRYGFDDKEFHTLEETGGKLGITRERVRQLERKALAKLSQVQRARELLDFIKN